MRPEGQPLVTDRRDPRTRYAALTETSPEDYSHPALTKLYDLRERLMRYTLEELNPLMDGAVSQLERSMYAPLGIQLACIVIDVCITGVLHTIDHERNGGEREASYIGRNYLREAEAISNAIVLTEDVADIHGIIDEALNLLQSVCV